MSDYSQFVYRYLDHIRKVQLFLLSVSILFALLWHFGSQRTANVIDELSLLSDFNSSVSHGYLPDWVPRKRHDPYTTIYIEVNITDYLVSSSGQSTTAIRNPEIATCILVNAPPRITNPGYTVSDQKKMTAREMLSGLSDVRIISRSVDSAVISPDSYKNVYNWVGALRIMPPIKNFQCKASINSSVPSQIDLKYFWYSDVDGAVLYELKNGDLGYGSIVVTGSYRYKDIVGTVDKDKVAERFSEAIAYADKYPDSTFGELFRKARSDFVGGSQQANLYFKVAVPNQVLGWGVIFLMLATSIYLLLDANYLSGYVELRKYEAGADVHIPSTWHGARISIMDLSFTFISTCVFPALAFDVFLQSYSNTSALFAIPWVMFFLRLLSLVFPIMGVLTIIEGLRISGVIYQKRRNRFLVSMQTAKVVAKARQWLQQAWRRGGEVR